MITNISIKPVIQLYIFPNLNVVHCWNHIKRDIRYHITKNYDKKAHPDITLYTDHLTKLLSCESEEVFQETFEKISIHWSPEYVSYFEKEIRPCIFKFIGNIYDGDV